MNDTSLNKETPVEEVDSSTGRIVRQSTNAFDEYDYQCAALDKGSPIPEAGLAYYSLAMGGEAGEVQNEIKKVYRDDGGIVTPARHDAIIKELGDLLWYASRVARLIGSCMNEVQRTNIEKLTARRAAGTLAGGRLTTQNSGISHPGYAGDPEGSVGGTDAGGRCRE